MKTLPFLKLKTLVTLIIIFFCLAFVACSDSKENTIQEIEQEDKDKDDDKDEDREIIIDNEDSIDPENTEIWELSWNDSFNYASRVDLFKVWTAQSGTDEHLLNSYWEENIEIGDEVVRFINKKESKGDKDWTSAGIYTKKDFQYGYFECRYKYATINATNSAFRLKTQQSIDPSAGKLFEININSGFYPNKVNTNIHNWSDITVDENGEGTHPESKMSLIYGEEKQKSRYHSYELETPIETSQIRLTSKHEGRIHIGEVSAYNVNELGYPTRPLEANAEGQVEGLVNYVREEGVVISGSGVLWNDTKNTYKNVADGKDDTRWISQDDGDKWLLIKLSEVKTIGCIQFLNGWGKVDNMLTDFNLEYWNGTEWKLIGAMPDVNIINFSKDYHTFGLQWTPKQLIFYMDRKVIRRETNTFSLSPSPILLDLSIIKEDGLVSDDIDETFMEIDYVKVYNRK